MSDIVRQLRNADVDGTVPCWVAAAGADEIDRLRAEVALLRARWRYVSSKAVQNTAHDRYGNGGHWTIGIFSDDSRKTFEAVVDAALSSHREETKR